MKGIIKSATATLFAVVALTTAALTTKAESAENVILTIEVAAEDGSVSTAHTYTIDDLRALQTTRFETETIWTEGEQVFTGVSLANVIAEFSLTEGEVEAVAINDYSVKIPVADAVPDGPIIAFERNGAEMSVRNKGPLWLVYPYDSNASYRSEAVYARSIWQLEKLIITK